MTATNELGSHPFGAKRDKITSMISSTLSANFTPLLEAITGVHLMERIARERKSFPTFDARVFMANRLVVGKMFVSRVKSCYRNAVGEFHDYFFGAKAAHGLSSGEKVERISACYNFHFESMCPPCLKYGVFIKGQKAIVPLTKPYDCDKFVDFLYAKDWEEKDCPFKYVLFEDMMEAYPSGCYIDKEIMDQKRVEFRAAAKMREEKEFLKEARSLEYPRPSREEVLRLRAYKKKNREERKNREE
jgi:hypothetical protein